MAQCALGRIFLRQTPGQVICPAVGSRTFSESSICSKGTVPSFTPSSSPNLDDLLSKFRENLFIPASLGRRHQKLIYKKSNAEQLLNQRITVNVPGSEEQVRLKPMSIADRPSSQDFKTAVLSMSTYSDWRNLEPLLTGLTTSKRPLRTHQMEWLMRKGCDAGKHGILLECAKKYKRTGLELRNVNVVRELYQGFHSTAQRSNFDIKVVERTLNQAKQAAFLVGLPKNKKVPMNEEADRRPDIIGVLLELSASRAMQACGGKDEHGEVVSYAKRTLDTWPMTDFSLEDTAGWVTANKTLGKILPLWHGMKLALDVEEVKSSDELRSALEKRIGELEPLIEAGMKTVSEAEVSYTPRKLAMCQELYKK